ncbi:DEAD-box ATP-dependent RNA helicase 36 [Nymphaea thermarum]|nr:DEAD-box ATP-dependent RNA helicase 36 [Nymphaea thermarum]
MEEVEADVATTTAPTATGFRIFSKRAQKPPPITGKRSAVSSPTPKTASNGDADAEPEGFEQLGLAQWLLQSCRELRLKKPTPVQSHCIPQILAGKDVMGLAQTGSGKTAAFALPILHRLGENPFGVFALVVTPTRELAYQLAEQFRALGSGVQLRCTVVVGGMNSVEQAKALVQRPHVVIATPGRIRFLLEDNPDIPGVFSKTRFLVLDEADRVLDVGFEDELRVIFQNLPKERQTLLFSATMTDELRALHELSADKAYFYEAYEGVKTVESLKQQYIFIPKDMKDIYLANVLWKMEENSVRSAIVFVATCRACHLLSLMLEELDLEAAALHSHKSQSLRLAALNKFKSGQVPILLATDVASRGLDIPTVDLVINYDIPRDPHDYVHRVGRTARAGRGGRALSLVTQNDVDLVHRIEDVIRKQLEEFECKTNEVLGDLTKVCKAKRVATMRMNDDGSEETVKERKAQKLRTLEDKGLLKKKKRKREVLKIT